MEKYMFGVVGLVVGFVVGWLAFATAEVAPEAPVVEAPVTPAEPEAPAAEVPAVEVPTPVEVVPLPPQETVVAPAEEATNESK